MELNLTRVDYLQSGLTHPRTMRLLPSPGGKAQQKVAVGDQDGVLQVFSVKKGDVSHAFKTLPGKEINRLELGGALGEFNSGFLILIMQFPRMSIFFFFAPRKKGRSRTRSSPPPATRSRATPRRASCSWGSTPT